jgi:hypothetical protein
MWRQREAVQVLVCPPSISVSSDKEWVGGRGSQHNFGKLVVISFAYHLLLCEIGWQDGLKVPTHQSGVRILRRGLTHLCHSFLFSCLPCFLCCFYLPLTTSSDLDTPPPIDIARHGSMPRPWTMTRTCEIEPHTQQIQTLQNL